MVGGVMGAGWLGMGRSEGEGGLGVRANTYGDVVGVVFRMERKRCGVSVLVWRCLCYGCWIVAGLAQRRGMVVESKGNPAPDKL